VLRGAAELHAADSRCPVLCEVAITVERAWQDQGVATELLRRVLVVARNRSARGVQVSGFGYNYRIRQIAQKFGARLCSRSGESEAEIPSPAPTYLSLCEGAIDDGFGWMSLIKIPLDGVGGGNGLALTGSAHKCPDGRDQSLP
jgi:hypothetical protein